MVPSQHFARRAHAILSLASALVLLTTVLSIVFPVLLVLASSHQWPSHSWIVIARSSDCVDGVESALRDATRRRVVAPKRILLVVLGEVPGGVGTEVVSVRSAPLQRLFQWSLWLHGAQRTPALIDRSRLSARRVGVRSLENRQ